MVIVMVWVEDNIDHPPDKKERLVSKDRKCQVLLWFYCEDWQAALATEEKHLKVKKKKPTNKQLSMQRIISHPKKKRSSIIGEGSYQLKNNRLYVVLSWKKISLQWRRDEKSERVLFLLREERRFQIQREQLGGSRTTWMKQTF